MEIETRVASPSDARTIAEMAVALTEEISVGLGERSFDIDLEGTVQLCGELMGEGRYVALVASIEGELIGFVGFSEGFALYAGGAIGTMQEVFVRHSLRTRGVGARLISFAVDYAKSHGWKRIEVCTPPLPAFQRSLSFYERNGFQITGGRKLKRIL